jgi:hypothetical protein
MVVKMTPWDVFQVGLGQCIGNHPEFKENRAIFLAHLQLEFLVASLCLVTQRIQHYFPLNQHFHVQSKAVVHKSDRVGASLNMLEQIILE